MSQICLTNRHPLLHSFKIILPPNRKSAGTFEIADNLSNKLVVLYKWFEMFYIILTSLVMISGFIQDTGLVQGILKGVCVNAQTRRKLEGTLTLKIFQVSAIKKNKIKSFILTCKCCTHNTINIYFACMCWCHWLSETAFAQGFKQTSTIPPVTSPQTCSKNSPNPFTANEGKPPIWLKKLKTQYPFQYIATLFHTAR